VDGDVAEDDEPAGNHGAQQELLDVSRQVFPVDDRMQY
jgi:hypothetical protein